MWKEGFENLESTRYTDSKRWEKQWVTYLMCFELTDDKTRLTKRGGKKQVLLRKF